MRRLIKKILPIALWLPMAAAMAIDVHVDIDTSALPAAGFVLAFDLVDGGSPGNTAGLGSLVSNGAFGAASFTGDAAAVPGGFRLGDTQFFNEILLPLSSATHLSFDIDMSLAAPAPGALPDAFAFFLLDRATLLPLVQTTDPSGSDALFTLQSGDSPLGPSTTFTDAGTGLPATWTVAPVPPPLVPEPATWLLMLAGVAALRLARGARRSRVRGLAMSLMALMALLPGLAAAALHVMPSGGTSSPHDGAKWETAFSARELQTAINNNAGAEFWLSRGAYGVLQNIPDGTQLYGGFVGGLLGETSRDQRDPAANFTEFDGILIVPYDDGTGTGNTIIQGPGTTVDGFQILGFGILLEKARPTLAHNVISGAPVGIDMRFGAAPTVNDSQVTGKSYGISVAGPVQTIKVGPNRVEAKPTINRSTIGAGAQIGLLENPAPGTLPTLVVNASTFSGAQQAMELFGNAQFSDCIVEKNGIGSLPAVQIGASDPGRLITFDRCKIRDNQGTGVLASPSTDSTVVIRRSEITGNNSSLPPPCSGCGGVPHAGGVLVNTNGVQIVESVITGNKTTSVGGGMYFSSFTNPTNRNLVVNSLIAGNSATVQGGGIASGRAAFSVLNSTIVGNAAPAGGGVWIDANPSPAFSFVNTAIVGNTAPLASAIGLDTFGTPTTNLLRNTVTLSTDTYASSSSNTPSASPLGSGSFSVVSAGFVAPASGDYRLAPASPLIDRGDSAPISAYIAAGGGATDLAGQPRIAGASVDVGAYEAAVGGVVDVSSQVSLRLGGLVYDRANRRYTQAATITNSSGGVLAGPVSLVFDGLPGGVTVTGMTNVTVNQLPAGSPYIDVLPTDFAAGALLTLNLGFADPLNTAIHYVPRVLSGAGMR